MDIGSESDRGEILIFPVVTWYFARRLAIVLFPAIVPQSISS